VNYVKLIPRPTGLDSALDHRWSNSDVAQGPIRTVRPSAPACGRSTV
jgi:hypothetical protein